MQTQTMCSATQLSLPHRYEDVTGPTNGTTHSFVCHQVTVLETDAEAPSLWYDKIEEFNVDSKIEYSP